MDFWTMLNTLMTMVVWTQKFECLDCPPPLLQKFGHLFAKRFTVQNQFPTQLSLIKKMAYNGIWCGVCASLSTSQSLQFSRGQPRSMSYFVTMSVCPYVIYMSVTNLRQRRAMSYIVVWCRQTGSDSTIELLAKLQCPILM